MSQREAALQNIDLPSPARLARLATTDITNTVTVAKIFDAIILQCNTRESIYPFFRFIEASLSVNPSTHHFIDDANHKIGIL
jgi:hypothetical protein